ncbi:Hint domain-containing protein [Moraxella oblonga]|uniref:Hint domain-containing protein n=1 Tax=Moraxella oblonga TaxID=200413 RepID=UPI001FE0D872|nr:Hint domain-containing protein [Moraxella oblonga]
MAGTLVHTDKGLVPIQNLKIGDKVLSRPENGDDILSYQPIISTFKSQKKEKIYKVEYFNQTAYQRGEGGTSYILCTANHPFWVTKQPNANQGSWIAAEDLPAGYLTSANKDIIELSDYSFLPVRTLPSFPNGYGYTQRLEEHDSWSPTNLSDVIFIKFNPEEYTYISFGRNDEERKSFKNSFGISEIIDPTEILGNKEPISYHPEDYGLLRVRLAQDTMKHYRSKKFF